MSVSIDGYLIDVFVSEQPTKQSRVTRYPIEEGASIADHVIDNPDKLTVTGIVSNASFGTTAEARSEDEKPSEEAYARLSKIHADKKLVRVVTSTRSFDNMLLLSLTDPRTRSTGDALDFTATFEKITTIDITTEQKVTQVRLPRHKRRKKKGATPSPPVVPAKEAKALTEAKEKTGLKWIADKAAGIN